MSTWLLLAVLAAEPRVILVWDSGKPREAQRALDGWYRALDNARVPPLKLAPGFPKIERHPREAGVEMVVIGACGPGRAKPILRMLRRGRPSVSTLRTRTGPDASTCPRPQLVPAANVTALMEELSPKTLARAAHAKAEIPLCALGKEALQRRHGDDYLCRSLWGIPCARYAELMLFFEGKPGCGALVEARDARRLIEVDSDVARLEMCTSGGDDEIAFVFAQQREGEHLSTPFPADAVCGQGPDWSTRIGRVLPMGDGACIELIRGYMEGGVSRTKKLLRCYRPTAAPPFALADEQDITAARYDIVDDALCLEWSDRVEPVALRFGGRTLEPVDAKTACKNAEFQ